MTPQANLPSIEKLVRSYSNGATLHHSELIFIHLVLYNMDLKAPSVEEVREWAEYYELDQCENCYVLAGNPSFIGNDSYNMIPGFQLVDKNFILRKDSTGHHPTHNLFTELLPSLPKLLKE